MVKIFNNAIYRVLGAHRFAEGGSINTDETDRPISQSKREVRGVNEFNAGGSHEENPYGGVPQGIAPDGAPNLVEQGEVKLSDIIGMDNQYILSNRIIIDAEHAQQFGIPENVVGMTYAAAFKKLYQPLKERSGSSEVKNEIAHLANAFMQAQDTVKAEQEAQQASAIMNSLSPEERQQMMQMAAGQQGQPSPEEQQMMQQQMQAQQQGQMAQDPSMMGGQQMPPEAMAAQGGQPSPEEMAMMQQQDPSMMGGQQPMMARGGRMINRFSKGGNMSFNKSMFGGVFSHKFAEGGNYESGGAEISTQRNIKTKAKPKSSDKKRVLKQAFSRMAQDSLKYLPTEVLARLAIKGKFGNEKARKAALGSRYSEVQKKVNEILSGSSKKVKVDDERGGKKEVEIPAWVGRADELNLEVNPIENRLPKTRDVRDADAMIEGVSLKDMDREPSYDAGDLQRYLVQNPLEELNLGDPSDELIRRARLAAR